ncbi:hypothetical protein C8J55DRAFT_549251 [Lentinula edodes]|uniref:F-box domain-containing protein n=1 Tax=Lentinula lateritia TaxID=40482 RepID=A0A9W9AH93_9AGAR|nr:hypothetical protein C8J55DRAFT_549251 [Lentinula edodes]
MPVPPDKIASYLFQSRIEGPVWLEPEEIALLHARRSEAEFEATSLSALKDANEKSLRRADAKLSEIALIQNILSPIRRLPLEILSQIFEHVCLPKYHERPDEDVINTTFALCQVCIAWRMAAYTTPAIWSKICIELDRKPETFSGDVTWVKEWLTRSRGLPLDIYLFLIDVWHVVTQDVKDRVNECLDFILNFHSQIRTLDLSGYPPFFIPLFRLPRASMPLLESVSIRVTDYDNDDDSVENLIQQHPFVEVLLGAPRLQTLKIQESGCQMSIVQGLALPVEQLTSLEIGADKKSAFDPIAYLNMLRHCTNLRSLKIGFPRRTTRHLSLFGSHNSFPLFLPSLKSLDILNGYYGGEFLSCFSVPLLKDLTLRMFGQANMLDLPTALSGLQSRSMTVLSSLALQVILNVDTAPVSQNLVAILAMFPTLDEFRLSITSIVSRFDLGPILQALTFVKGRPVLLPKLTVIDLELTAIRMDRTTDEYPSDLTSLVLSRWWPDNSELLVHNGDHEEKTSEHPGMSKLRQVILRGICYKGADIAPISALSGLNLTLEECLRLK